MRLALALALAPLLLADAAAAPASRHFGAVEAPSDAPSAPLGDYNRGCLAGAAALAETGPAWQVMRPSRNRRWGHPAALDLVGRLAAAAQEAGWPGLLVGDISQPRGGPMTSGHRSHQIGLDVDIWLTPAPDRRLTREERDTIGAQGVVAADRVNLNGGWTPAHHAILKRAGADPAVARIFVNPAIKRRLCADEPPGDRGWLRRIRPWWGHDAHFHVRLHCPPDVAGCVGQAPPPPGDGCDETLEWWFTDEALDPAPPSQPPRELTLADLPAECRAVLDRE